MLTRSLHFAKAHAGHHPHLTRRVGAPAHLFRRQGRNAVHADIVSDRFRGQPVAWVKTLWKRLDTDRSLGLAAEMAFWLFLSFLPLAAVAGLVAAKLFADNWSSAAPLMDSLPTATRDLVTNELSKVAAWNGGKVGISAALMFIWLASSGIHSIFDGIELETEAKPRPWWKKRALAIGACVALSVGVALLALLGTGLGWLWRWTDSTLPIHALMVESSVVGQIVRVLIGAAISFGLVSGLYWIALPPAVRKSMPIAPGAILAIALQTVLGFGYGFYINKAGDSGAYLAGLASIGVTLMALYLFCLALLIGVEINQMLGDRRRTLAAHGASHA